MQITKNLKAAAIGIALVTAASVALFGADTWSYFTTAGAKARSAARESVPIEFEIERARQMAQSLLPDIRANVQVIAREEVNLEHVARQIAAAEEKLAADRRGLSQLKDAVAEGRATYRFAGRSYSADEVKLDLAQRFERYKSAEATVASLREIRSAREKGLDAARRKLQGMIAAKRQLDIDVEQLGAQLKLVEASQTAANFQFDDSGLARTKKLVAEIRDRLTVAQKVLDAEGREEGIVLDEVAPDDIAEQVARHLGEGPVGAGPIDTESSDHLGPASQEFVEAELSAR